MGDYVAGRTQQNVFSSQTGNPYHFQQIQGQTFGAIPKIIRVAQSSTWNRRCISSVFGGKNFDGSIIGLAYVGVICSDPDYAYGTTQNYNPSADASIVAHELGS